MKINPKGSDFVRGFISAIIILIFCGFILFLIILIPSKKRSFSEVTLKNGLNSTENNLNRRGTGTFTDSRDGRIYRWVRIGAQIWMAENLAYLPNVNRVTEGSENDETGKYYYVFNYNGSTVEEAKATQNYQKYGVLYNWNAATNSCPLGWHLPGNKEWDELVLLISDEQKLATSRENVSYILPFLLEKDAWGLFFQSENIYGFSALPSGTRSGYVGEEWRFLRSKNDSAGLRAAFWSSTKIGNENASVREIDTWACSNCFFNSVVSINEGLSLRCVKD